MAELRRFTGEKLDDAGTPLGQSCDWPECARPATFQPCNAEGDSGRAHWHGGIHRLDNGAGFHFCDEHALMVLADNERIMRERHAH